MTSSARRSCAAGGSGEIQDSNQFAPSFGAVTGLYHQNQLLSQISTIEGYFSNFERGMKGIYQHCGEKHLHRYLAEFDFRYCHREANGVNDTARAVQALVGAEGRRLMYRDSLWACSH